MLDVLLPPNAAVAQVNTPNACLWPQYMVFKTILIFVGFSAHAHGRVMVCHSTEFLSMVSSTKSFENEKFAFHSVIRNLPYLSLSGDTVSEYFVCA